MATRSTSEIYLFVSFEHAMARPYQIPEFPGAICGVSSERREVEASMGRHCDGASGHCGRSGGGIHLRTLGGLPSDDCGRRHVAAPLAETVASPFGSS